MNRDVGSARRPSIYRKDASMNVVAAQSTENAVKAIDKLRDAHIASLNNGDAGGWVDAFTDDGVQMPPHFPANAGRAAIRGWADGFLGAFGVDFAISPREVEVTGPDWAFETGTWEISLAPKGGGEPMQDAGKYVTVYQRQPDNSWLMARDIWNSDNPLPGM
jgi:uncharacterized protein (TIGR02246 family)